MDVEVGETLLDTEAQICTEIKSTQNVTISNYTE